MKMRYILLGYTVVVMLLLCFILTMQTEENQYSIDMLLYNRKIQAIQKELEASESVANIEKKYDCDILYVTDDEYSSNLSKYISEGAVIFDYINDDGELAGKFVWEMSKNRYEELSRERMEQVIFIVVAMSMAGYILLAVIYRHFIRPFKVLDKFSGEIAKGNLDFRLPIEKGNMFGAFTESFDIMREELKAAREREYEANISKKELVAELSHDVKTPVSTIKATCEVMQIKETNEATKEKLGVIISKADMIDQLVGNMFHATMEELQVLKVEVAEESTLCIPEMFNDLKYYGSIVLEGNIPQCLVYLDKLRMKQIIDNIVNNSYKYAGTDIRVSFNEIDNGIKIIIRDFGKGVPEEELALVSEKYYRGTNAKGKSGSGIGLYLSKMFMEQMKGELTYYNDSGFVVELFLKKVRVHSLDL